MVQLLLYAMGCRLAGYRVDRVVLAALPRTAPTMSQMYVWERVHTPEDDLLVSQVLAETELRWRLAQGVLSRQIDISEIPWTPNDACKWCFSGDTEIVTRDGIKPIAELAGTSPELLVPVITGEHHALQPRGRFRPVPVRAFGEQQLWKILLTSRRAKKTVYATAEHRWLLTVRPSRARTDNKYGHLIRGRERPAEQFERTTQELQPGDRLRSLRATRPAAGGAQLMPWAVAQGFVFGDGHLEGGNRPAGLVIYDNGKDEALLPFFPFAAPRQRNHKDSRTGETSVIKVFYGLPRFWKTLPPIRESRTFLLSWLAGYFAADGRVSAAGQASLDSADKELSCSPAMSRQFAASGTTRHAA